MEFTKALRELEYPGKNKRQSAGLRTGHDQSAGFADNCAVISDPENGSKAAMSPD
jgi:hypothetical protein